MTDRALTKEAVLAGMQDIRLPTDAPGGLGAELFVAVGLGLLLALGLGLMLRLTTQARTKRQPSLRQQVKALAALPEAERQLALLQLLKATKPDRFAVLLGAIYRAGGLPDSTRLEAELIRHV